MHLIKFFKNSTFDGYMNKAETHLWFYDKLHRVLSLEAMISREPERARQEMREVKVSDREPVTTTQPHLCPTWRKCTPGSEIKIITHTSIHTMSFFVCGAGALPAELECFYMRHVAFSFFKVQRLRLWFQSLEFEITSQLCLANNHRNSNT